MSSRQRPDGALNNSFITGQADTSQEVDYAVGVAGSKHEASSSKQQSVLASNTTRAKAASTTPAPVKAITSPTPATKPNFSAPAQAIATPTLATSMLSSTAGHRKSRRSRELTREIRSLA